MKIRDNIWIFARANLCEITRNIGARQMAQK